MIVNKIVIGTTNRAKQQDYKNIIESISNISVEILFPQNLKITEKPHETGATFAENSLIKAKFYFKKTGIPTIADDGGLEIPILGGEPGVLSRRWLGRKSSDEELINYTLERLKNYKTKKDRTALLKTCITYFDGKHVFQETGVIKGYIANQRVKKYIKGYPFRAFFIISRLEKYYDEFTKEEHEKFNHRKKALQRLWNRINSRVYHSVPTKFGLR